MILLPYPLSVNRYWRNFRGRMVISTEGRAFKTEAAWKCKAGGQKLMSGPVELLLKLHPKQTKGGVASKVLIDLDNALKCVCDCMNGIAYEDDSQIMRIVAEVGSAIAGGGVSIEVKRMEAANG
jgi:crossover junction endodeoxyribonuclease RusA